MSTTDIKAGDKVVLLNNTHEVESEDFKPGQTGVVVFVNDDGTGADIALDNWSEDTKELATLFGTLALAMMGQGNGEPGVPFSTGEFAKA